MITTIFLLFSLFCQVKGGMDMMADTSQYDARSEKNFAIGLDGGNKRAHCKSTWGSQEAMVKEIM